jgi:hypothetical protein
LLRFLGWLIPISKIGKNVDVGMGIRKFEDSKFETLQLYNFTILQGMSVFTDL